MIIVEECYIVIFFFFNKSILPLGIVCRLFECDYVTDKKTTFNEKFNGFESPTVFSTDSTKSLVNLSCTRMSGLYSYGSVNSYILYWFQIRRWLEYCRKRRKEARLSMLPDGLTDERRIQLQGVITSIREKFPVGTHVLL